MTVPIGKAKTFPHNSGIAIIGKGIKRGYRVKCNTCGYETDRLRPHLLYGCGQCAGKCRTGFTRQQLQSRCHEEIEYIRYIGKSQHLVRCRKCGTEMKRTANHMANQCSQCRDRWKAPSHKVPEEILKATLNTNFSFIKRLNHCERVSNNSKLILVKCNKCNIERTRSPYELAKECQCFATCYESAAEKELNSWIQSFGLETRKLKLPYQDQSREFDIYIPSLNLAIEYNGLYWHNEHNLAKRLFDKPFEELTSKEKGKIYSYHIDKTKLAAQSGITLIHIWEHEWLERPEQVKNFLHGKLRLGKSVGARKCEFREIPKKEAQKFCEENHIQGAPRDAELSIGAFYQDELVLVTTYAEHHRQTGGVVLNRMCSKFGMHVSGGLSKMSQMATKHFGQSIKTWVHKTLSDGQSYVKAGWEIVDELRPDYFYQKGQKAYSKQSHKKDCIKIKAPEIYSPNKTERQMSVEMGLGRLWDCGKFTLIFKGKL